VLEQLQIKLGAVARDSQVFTVAALATKAARQQQPQKKCQAGGKGCDHDW
jgi:hypothetical protein